MDKLTVAHPPAQGSQAGESRALSSEVIVSSLLRFGVLISLALVAIGVILMLATGGTGYGGGLDLPGLLTGEGAPSAAWPHTVGSVLSGTAAARPYALILLGLLLLIATPVLRVIISVFLFMIEHDHLYVLITLFVLGVLLLSFLLGRVE